MTDSGVHYWPRDSVAAIGLLVRGACRTGAAARGAPARIVSTSPSITETLFALGLGDRVVGVSTFCRFPPEAAKLPKVGTFLKPDAELIAGLRPDLVVVHEVSTGIDRKLASLRIPFVVVDRGTLASVFSSIRQIGGAAGVPDRADTLVADIERRLDAVRRAGGRAPRPRVLFIIGRQPGHAHRSRRRRARLLPERRDRDRRRQRTCSTIAGQPEYPRISMETVLRLDPDVIVDTVDMGETEAERRQRQPINERLWSAYGTLTAVKTGRAPRRDDRRARRPGPRVVEAAEWVAALLRETVRPMSVRLQIEDVAWQVAGRPVLSGVSLDVRGGEVAVGDGTQRRRQEHAARHRRRASAADRRRRCGSTIARPPSWDPRARARLVAHLPQSVRPDLPFLAGELVLMGRYPHTDRWFESEEDRPAVERRDAAHRTAGTCATAWCRR